MPSSVPLRDERFLRLRMIFGRIQLHMSRLSLFLVLLASIGASQPTTARTVHVFVALCDNANQGIVPVPGALGNGQDPNSNLYWGALYGVKTHFGNCGEWERLKVDDALPAPVLDRMLFKNRKSGDYLLAEAYDGARMRTCIVNYFNALAGHDTVHVAGLANTIRFGGGADLVRFVGHNGLMDFALLDGEVRAAVPGRNAGSMVLCCYSERYFNEHVAKANGQFMLGTRGLMAPEAYVLRAALGQWILRQGHSTIREAAAQAYHHYQKCGVKAARNLFGAKSPVQ